MFLSKSCYVCFTISIGLTIRFDRFSLPDSALIISHSHSPSSLASTPDEGDMLEVR